MTQNSPESSNKIGQLGANDDELCLGIHNDDLVIAFDAATKVGRAISKIADNILRASSGGAAEAARAIQEYFLGPRP